MTAGRSWRWAVAASRRSRDNPLLDEHILDLARWTRGRDRPRVCFLPTASGDAEGYVARFYAALARRSEAATSRCSVGPSRTSTQFLLDQDVIYVGGGNTANMLAVWRVHGVDRVLRRASEAGVVLAGQSAGSICWFEAGTTDSFGRRWPRSTDGLGFLSGSHSPHYDGEPAAPSRLPATRRGRRASGGLRRRRRRGPALPRHGILDEVVASRPMARGYRVERGPDGGAIETRAADPLPRLTPHASARSAHPTPRSAGPRPDPRSRPARRRAVSTVSPQPGGTRPGARSASGASTNRRSPASRDAAPRAASRPWPDRPRRRWNGPRAVVRWRAAPGRRRAGRGRARADPSARRRRRPKSRSRPLSDARSVRRARRRIRARRDVERDDRVAEVGLVGDADRCRGVEPRDAPEPCARAGRPSAPTARSASVALGIADVRPEADVGADGPSRLTAPPSATARLALAMRPVAVRILHPEPGPARVRSSAGSPPRGRGVAERHRVGFAARRRGRCPDRRRAARRYTVRRASPRAASRCASARPASWSSGPARFRWPRPRPPRRSCDRGRVRGPPGARQQPLLGRRRGDRLRGERSRTSPTCRRQRAAPLARRRSLGTRSTTFAAGGGSRSTSTGRSTSLLVGRGRAVAAVEAGTITGPGSSACRRPSRAGSAGRAGRRRADVGRDAALARDGRPRTRRPSSRSAGCGARPGPAGDGGPAAPRPCSGCSSSATGRPRSATISPGSAMRPSSTRGCCWPIGSVPTSAPGRAAEDRFASDLLLADRVADPWLREPHRVGRGAPIPVLLGGHTLVGPGPAPRCFERRPMDLTAGLRRDPPLDLEAVGEDEALAARIRDEITANGPMTFARFMELALYDPEGGYYRGAEPRPGRSGDFLTAPEAHPIFGRAVASQLDEVWERLERPDAVRRPRARRRRRDPRRGHPRRPRARRGRSSLGRSALRARSRSSPAASRRSASGCRGRLRGHASRRRATDHPFAGVVLANEVLDALPVHRVGGGTAPWPSGSSTGADGAARRRRGRRHDAGARRTTRR